MMQSEFTELTKIHVDGAMYTEIENRYMESGMSKQEFCKAYKANKDGMQEAVAYEASIKKAIEMDKKDQEIREWERKFDREQELARNNHKALFDAKTELEGRLDEVQRALDLVNMQNAEMEKELNAKDQEIMMLKAKLYDMMMKGVA